jgi:hypothetical protein
VVVVRGVSVPVVQVVHVVAVLHGGVFAVLGVSVLVRFGGDVDVLETALVVVVAVAVVDVSVVEVVHVAVVLHGGVPAVCGMYVLVLGVRAVLSSGRHRENLLSSVPVRESRSTSCAAC